MPRTLSSWDADGLSVCGEKGKGEEGVSKHNHIIQYIRSCQPPRVGSRRCSSSRGDNSTGKSPSPLQHTEASGKGPAP